MVQLKKKLKKDYDPDVLFLEPSEMIVTRELRDVVKIGLRDIKYDIGPFVTLIDGPSFSFQWEERSKLLLGQVQTADIIAISRTDMIESNQIEQIRNTLTLTDNNLLLLSRETSSAVEELVQQILAPNQED